MVKILLHYLRELQMDIESTCKRPKARGLCIYAARGWSVNLTVLHTYITSYSSKALFGSSGYLLIKL